jgi:RNA polymerase sigma-70 factor (ECF subfamily)
LDNLGISDKEIETAFNSYYGLLHRYAYTILRDNEKASDIVQQVFVRICNRKELIQIDYSLKTYLYKSVHNNCLNALNRDRKFEPLNTMHPTAQGTGTSEYLEAKELQKSIGISIEKLSPQCKQVFLLSRDEGKTYNQIAADLNISVKTVEAHISKALRFLKEDLEELIHV